MPIVKVSMLAGRSAEIKKEIAADITQSLVRHLGNDPQHIYVMFEDVATTDWAVGGTLFSNMENHEKK